jgi:predicted amidohydrolase YtcJ
MTATILTRGTVLTCDTKGTVAEAVAINGGRVIAVGDRDDVRVAAGAGARTIDLDGAAVLPGLIDTHPHVMHFGVFAYPLVDLSDAVDQDDIVARIAAKAATVPVGEWVMTTPVGEAHYFLRRSWRDLKEGRLPRREVLDRATTEHPVIIQAWAPTTPNVMALNSAGLLKLGITAELPDVMGRTTIHKDGAGEPTGILSGSTFADANQKADERAFDYGA